MLNSLIRLETWLVLTHRLITRAACAHRLHSHWGLTCLQPASPACTYQTILHARTLHCFSALADTAWVVADINPSAHHSRGLCSQAAFALWARSFAYSLLCLLACITPYCSHITFSALADTAWDVAGINPSAHHSRSLCSQAAFTLRAQRPSACFACSGVSTILLTRTVPFSALADTAWDVAASARANLSDKNYFQKLWIR